MYALSLGARWFKPAERFVILTSGRTGSALLVDLLDSHPDIVCDPEVLKDPPAYPARFLAGRATLAALGGASAYGFKINRSHLGYLPLTDHDLFLHRLSGDGVHLFRLSRRDALGQAISAVVAPQTQWHWRRGDSAELRPPTVDPAQVLLGLDVMERSERGLDAALASLPHLRFTYEDDLVEPADQQATVDRICTRLALTRVPVSSDLVRRSPRRLEDRVANFDEVVKALRPTRFGGYVERY